MTGQPKYRFSDNSLRQLNTCHRDLVRLMWEVANHIDITIIEGHRSNERQDSLFRQGSSKLRGGQSKHNSDPSMAVDVAPYPIDWQDRERFLIFGGFVLGMAAKMGIPLRWGGDWDGDGYTTDQNFHDMVHFELVDKRL